MWTRIAYGCLSLMMSYSICLPAQSISRHVADQPTPKVANLLRQLKQPEGKEVLVVAHRGDWRNAPENSLLAIQSAIAMGVDIVEIDVQKTKDGHLVIMHDETLDRTTNGKGYVKDYTLDSLRKLYLKNGLGRPTYHRIPTLEEAMLAAKGQALVNLDKSYAYIREAYAILVKTGTLNQALFKGSQPVEQVKKDYGDLLDQLLYMPIVELSKPNALVIVEAFQRESKPVAFELIFTNDTSLVFGAIAKIKARGARIWVNSLWTSLNGGHDDDLAETNPEDSYGWLINQGINLIQTDRPRELLLYLKEKGMRK